MKPGFHAADQWLVCQPGLRPRAVQVEAACGVLLSPFPRKCRIPGEWAPGRGSAKPIAYDGRRAALDAVTASRTIESEENGDLPHP